jgi:hypothetical protein
LDAAFEERSPLLRRVFVDPRWEHLLDLQGCTFRRATSALSVCEFGQRAWGLAGAHSRHRARRRKRTADHQSAHGPSAS